ncbi:hypothetical protein RB195_003677 [Necator americanus]|uniref:DUF7774 domain-containing protein n=1 Tax=Necator americanus TaxID=51031 RepID=A0ABR1DPP3_NECAM
MNIYSGAVSEIIPEPVTIFEQTGAPFAPAIVNERAHIFRWKEDRQIQAEPTSAESMRKEKENVFGREIGVEGNKAVHKLQRSIDLRIASRIMAQVRQNNLLENFLSPEKNSLIKQFFESGFVNPSKEVMEALNEAIEGCCEIFMFRQDQHNINVDNEIRDFLLDKEKAKKSLLDVMLKIPQYVPLAWGGQIASQAVTELAVTDLVLDEMTDFSSLSTRSRSDGARSENQATDHMSCPPVKCDPVVETKNKKTEEKELKRCASKTSDSDSSDSDSPVKQKKVQSKLGTIDQAYKSIMTMLPLEPNLRKIGTAFEFHPTRSKKQEKSPTPSKRFEQQGQVQDNTNEVRDKGGVSQMATKIWTDSQAFTNKAGSKVLNFMNFTRKDTSTEQEKKNVPRSTKKTPIDKKSACKKT